MHADARRGRCRAGFSLIEILVVISLVAGLTVILMMSMNGGMDGLRLRAEAKTIASELRRARFGLAARYGKDWRGRVMQWASASRSFLPCSAKTRKRRGTAPEIDPGSSVRMAAAIASVSSTPRP